MSVVAPQCLPGLTKAYQRLCWLEAFQSWTVKWKISLQVIDMHILFQMIAQCRCHWSIFWESRCTGQVLIFVQRIFLGLVRFGAYITGQDNVYVQCEYYTAVNRKYNTRFWLNILPLKCSNAHVVMEGRTKCAQHANIQDLDVLDSVHGVLRYVSESPDVG